MWEVLSLHHTTHPKLDVVAGVLNPSAPRVRWEVEEKNSPKLVEQLLSHSQ